MVRVMREMGLVPKSITRQDVEDLLQNEKGYSIAHTCNEHELSFFMSLASHAWNVPTFAVFGPWLLPILVAFGGEWK